MATDTIRKLYESQQEMLGHHQQLQITQEGVMTQITDNMESLKTEKALIAAGNKELADRTQNIKQKLGIVKTLNKELTDRTQNIKQKLGIVKTLNKELADRTQNIKQKLGIVKTLNKGSFQNVTVFSNEVSFIWFRPPTHPLQMKV